MRLTFLAPFDEPRHLELRAFPGRTLGELCAPHAQHVTGCQVNGVFVEAWQAYQPHETDRVTFFVQTGFALTTTAGALTIFGAIVLATATTVISLGIQYLLRALTPTPSNTAGKTEQIYGIAGVTNTTALGTPKFFHYGTQLIFGHIIDTRVAISSDGKTTNFGILYFMGEGPIQGMTDVQINDTPLEQFPDVQSVVRLGDENTEPLPGFDTVSSVWSDGRALPLTTPLVYQTRGEQVERATVILATPLLVNQNADGGKEQATHTLQIEYTTVGDASYQDADGSPFVWTDKVESTRFKPFALQFDHADQWLIRVTLTATTNQNDTPPLLYNVQEETTGSSTYPTSALLALTGIASSQITSFEAMRGAALVQGRVVRKPVLVAGVWDGTSYENAWTNNRAWVLRDILTDARVGLGHRIDESLWDDASAVAAANYWDGIAFGAIKRDQCDVLINDRRAAWDWIKIILSEGRAVLIPSGGQLKLVIDKAASPTLLYSMPGNIIEGSVVQTFGEGQGLVPNTIRGQFRDAEANYQLQILEINAPGAEAEPVRETLVTLSTLTTLPHAYWLLRYQLLRARLVQRHFTWQSPRSALVSEPLDHASLAYETTTMYRGISGFLAEGSTTTRLILDRLVTLDAGTTYALIVRHQTTNTVDRTTVATGAGTWGALAPTVALTATPVAGDLWALGAQDVAIVPVVIESVEQTDEGNYALTASRYEASVHETPEPPAPLGGGPHRTRVPLPLWAVGVVEQVEMTNDGTAATRLVYGITPQLQSHAGQCQAGSTTTTLHLAADEPMPLDLVHLAGTLDGYYRGGATVVVTGGTGQGQARVVTGYLGDTQTLTVSPVWGVTPDDTSTYTIAWPVFNDTTGFFVEQADVDMDGAISSAFVALATFEGHIGDSPAPTGPVTWALRFTPTSVEGVPNRLGRWIVLLTILGDPVGPESPTGSGGDDGEGGGEGGTGGDPGDAGDTGDTC